MNTVEATVRAAFEEQAQLCSELGSDFMALLCKTVGERLNSSTKLGAAILNWSGDPSPRSESLPLRLAGGLHSLVLNGINANLENLYPPHPRPGVECLWSCIEASIKAHEPELARSLSVAPQTNEVGRSAILLPGLLYIAEAIRLPLRLYEIGASAGLNLVPDLYGYEFGDAKWGNDGARPLMRPAWTGQCPSVRAPLNIVARCGSDIAPLDLKVAEDRIRLLSYVWPDQLARIDRLRQAIEVASPSLPRIDQMEAAQWVDNQFSAVGDGRSVRVLMHSIVWNYLSIESQKRISLRMEQCARSATESNPCAWLRFEMEDGCRDPTLRLTMWPLGEDRVLAHAQPHGNSVHYLG